MNAVRHKMNHPDPLMLDPKPYPVERGACTIAGI